MTKIEKPITIINVNGFLQARRDSIIPFKTMNILCLVSFFLESVLKISLDLSV
jgi:hypothetical protein